MGKRHLRSVFWDQRTKENYWRSSKNKYTKMRSTNFFHKESERKYFGFCKLYGLDHKYLILPLKYYSIVNSHRQYVKSKCSCVLIKLYLQNKVANCTQKYRSSVVTMFLCTPLLKAWHEKRHSKWLFSHNNFFLVKRVKYYLHLKNKNLCILYNVILKGKLISI